jgi:hypothetical protein
MKTLIAFACSFLFLASAHSAPLPNPSAAAITGGIQCGQPLVTAVVTGFSVDGESVLGQVSTHFSCSAGGRGARPHTYNACALIAWSVADLNYQLAYLPCAAEDPTLVFNFNGYSTWTMDGVGQLLKP